MDFTFSSAPAFRDKLPPAADVVIIGGGIIGISTAWYLNKRGKSVVMRERPHCLRAIEPKLGLASGNRLRFR